MLASAEILISKGARLDVTSPRGQNLLHFASDIKELKFFKLLCVSGYGDWDVHAKDRDGFTPMHYLFREAPKSSIDIENILQICRILMTMRRPNGDDLVNAEDKESARPLAYAVKNHFAAGLGYGDWESASNFGSDVETVVQALLDKGTNYAAQDLYGNTPLRCILRKAPLALIEFFLQKYSEIGNQSPNNNPLLLRDSTGETLFHDVAHRSEASPENSEVFGRVLEALSPFVDIKKYITEQNSYEMYTPLLVAVDEQNLEMVKLIMSVNTDINQRGSDGCSALDYVCNLIAKFAVDELGGAGNERTLAINTSIFYHIIDTATTFSFSILECQLFEPKIFSKVMEILDIPRIIAVFDAPFRDRHG
ncbi:hypothetical protein TWF694_002056 [Orbilia ellipsospora]|uniref:Ankyrin repeat protein n=1 Tax=Orbilia ellipsospora TaxID=2528407 RepID=A0AAV9X5K4_9PEZI